MTILHTCTVTRYSPAYRARVENTRWITRNRRLTTAGCERVIRREDRDNGNHDPGNPAIVTRVETAVYVS